MSVRASLLMALLMLQATASSLTAQTSADNEEASQTLAFGAGALLGLDEHPFHLFMAFEHQASEEVYLGLEGGLVFDVDDEGDPLVGSAVPTLRINLLQGKKASPFVVVGPAVFGTASGAALLLHGGLGLDLPSDDGSFLVMLRGYLGPQSFHSFFEAMASFAFDL